MQTNRFVGRKVVGICRSAVMATTLLAPMVPAAALAAQDSHLAAAQEEGEVNVYVLWLTDTVSAVTEAFEEKYPKIDVEFYRNGGPLVAERFRSEFEASGHSADILSLDPASLKRFSTQGMLEAYKAPDADMFPEWGRSPDNYWTTFFSYANGQIVNTNAFPDKKDWPKDWADFADPKAAWKGKVCTGDIRVASHTFYNLAAIYEHYGADGPDSVWAQYKGLAKSDVRIYTGAPQARNLVASGECPLIHQIPFHNFVAVAKAGAPVAWVVPKEGMIPIPEAVAVGKNAQHPNAAKLFYDFLLSKDGQAAIGNTHLTPLREDASTDWWPDDYGLPPAKDAKLMQYDPIKADAQRQMLLEKGGEILGLQ